MRHGPNTGPTYDGWVVFYAGAVATGSGLSTEWIVPLPPTNVGDQDLAFFNDIETQDIILQPVLDFSEIPGHWAIESENCCVQNNDVQSTLVEVTAGDTIQGVITAAGCNSSDDCTDSAVTTTDVTTGMSTALHMQNPGAGEVANEIDSAVLETYGVTSCDVFPASGEATFFDNALTDGQGAPEAASFELETILSPAMYPAGFPRRAATRGRNRETATRSSSAPRHVCSPPFAPTLGFEDPCLCCCWSRWRTRFWCCSAPRARRPASIESSKPIPPRSGPTRSSAKDPMGTVASPRCAKSGRVP